MDVEEARARAPLALKATGLATMYVAVPLGTFRAEGESFRRASEEGRIRRALVAESPVEILHLTGQADLLLQLRVTNFRPIVDLEYPGQNSNARVFNWIFSVPYDLPDLPGQGRAAVGTPRLRFNVHLRVRRSAYASAPSRREGEIVRTIRAVLGGEGFAADVAIGLGWADLIVDGVVAVDRLAEFSERLLRLHATQVQLSTGPYPVFERTLTLIGYEPSEIEGDAATLRPIVFARGVPGGLDALRASLHDALGITDSHAFVIDGKADAVLPITEALPALLRRHRDLCAPVGPGDEDWHRRENPIQRLETHLLFKDIGPVVGSAPAVSDPPSISAVSRMPPAVEGSVCDCDKRIPLHRVSHRMTLFPDELRQAMGNVRQLFRASVSDRTSCCDVSGAITGAENGLSELAIDLGQRNCRLDDAANTPEEDERHAAILDQHKQIEIWGLLAERILRQRTVGSFEELLGQTDRAIAYRGGVQKFLFLADALLDDFSRTVQLGLRLEDLPSRAFVTLYDSINEIRSVRGTGFIRIPVKHLFRLPLIVPDLWHEVGIYYFFLSPRFQFDEIMDDHPAAEKYPRHELARIVEFFYRDLGDQYADAITYLFGFHGRLPRFMLSLVRGWLEANKGMRSAPNVRRRLYEQILVRLYTVAELHRTRRREAKVPTSDSFVDALETMRIIDEFIAKRFGSRLPSGDNDIISNAARYVTSYTYARWVRDRLIRDLAQVEVRVPPRLNIENNLRRGDLCDIGGTVDINSLFGRFYWSWESGLARSAASERETSETVKIRQVIFRGMASLGRSAMLEYHRRDSEAYVRRIAKKATTG